MANPDEKHSNVVVVGVDGSESSKEALLWAVHQAELTGASLRVVTTWAYPAALGWNPQLPDDFNPAADAASAQKTELDETLGANPSVPVEAEVIEGHTAAVLIEMSKEAGLIVLGSRGHGGFTGLLIGSVSANVVSHASCPVVVVRS